MPWDCRGRDHRYPAGSEISGVPVGAGLPAKRPALTHKDSRPGILPHAGAIHPTSNDVRRYVRLRIPVAVVQLHAGATTA
ncbi:hypothetical protein EGT09_15515 [Pseudomonas putida]|nr:hypothetical protein EGT09_15515 [Pseudomonas putida]